VGQLTEAELLDKLVEIDPYCDLMVTEPDSDGKVYYVVYLSIEAEVSDE
jgi:hypothetical protein